MCMRSLKKRQDVFALRETVGLYVALFMRVPRQGNVNRRLSGNWMAGPTHSVATSSIGVRVRVENRENKYTGE